ncbi:MAG: hypothetical protein IPP32_08710 [Bacteroidetes bacterium]|nr:hypothetical protein [Bacteroidota bacterium]
MGWFNFLKEEGYFNPEKNPDSIDTGQGIQTPYWESITYLEKLSIKIKNGERLELIDEVISIIKNVSEHPKDNYRTWYLFIKILINLPNETVKIDVLKYLPVWFSGKFESVLQSSELCTRLLPKFLNDNPSKDDALKAEFILHFLFQLERPKVYNKGLVEKKEHRYKSKVKLYYFNDVFTRQNLIPKLVKSCSNDLILNLADSIKKLLFDYPEGISAKVNDEKGIYDVKVFIEDKNLLILSNSKGAESSFSKSEISNFEELDERELKLRFVDALKDQGINYTPTEGIFDAFSRVIFSLNNDRIFSFGQVTAISKLGKRHYNDEETLSVFVLLFRDILNEKVRQDPDNVSAFLRVLCKSTSYRMPLFTRIVLYIIGQNWHETKSLFWEIIGDSDSAHIFSKYRFRKELFELLDKNQLAFTSNEKEILEKIIGQGEQEEVQENDEKHLEYWQLGWYSALKNVEPFREKYELLSQLLKVTKEHFDVSDEIKVRSGSISPLTLDNLLKKTNQEVFDFLTSFKPKDRWEEPNIDGLADTLERAISIEPQKFAEEIQIFQDVYYIYSYHILKAFGNAWKNGLSFNWESILNYCLSYIKSDNFYSENLLLPNDGWNVSSEWVVGSIANLLTEGMQNDKNAFDLKLLPVAKKILQILAENLKSKDNSQEELDYPTYSLNSTSGKVLRALLDYSLRRARNLFKQNDANKWEGEIKHLFEVTLKRGIIDGHILEGMYFNLFYYLDKDWITDQVIQHSGFEEEHWLPFFNGYLFEIAPFNKEIYDLFYPHYNRAIGNTSWINEYYNQGIIRHLVSFYLWGYEDLSDTSLTVKFLNNATTKQVSDYVSFYGQLDNYPKSLDELSRKNFDQILFALWKYILNKYTNTTKEEEQRIIAELIHFVELVPELNKTYTELLLESCKFIHYNFASHELVKGLIFLKDKGNPLEAAMSIGAILPKIKFEDYIIGVDQDQIKELVEFLFKFNQKEIAIAFCNNMAIKQQLFLRDVYKQYTA